MKRAVDGADERTNDKGRRAAFRFLLLFNAPLPRTMLPFRASLFRAMPDQVPDWGAEDLQPWWHQGIARRGKLPRRRACRRKAVLALLLTPPRTSTGGPGAEPFGPAPPLGRRPIRDAPPAHSLVTFSCGRESHPPEAKKKTRPPVGDPATFTLRGSAPGRRPTGCSNLPRSCRNQAGGRQRNRRTVLFRTPESCRLTPTERGGYPRSCTFYGLWP